MSQPFPRGRYLASRITMLFKGRAPATGHLRPAAAASVKINITELIAEGLPHPPSWHNIGSSVTHSIY
jgi:hypothetical protein